MLKPGWVCFVLAGAWAFSLAGPAEATPASLTSFKQAYPAAKAASCKVCHLNPVGKKGDLNAYGLALQKLKLPKTLTQEDYKAVETQDSDGDKVPNGKEIEAGTGPGDPKSVPAGKGARRKRSDTAQKLMAYVDRWSAPAAWADEGPAAGKAEASGAASDSRSRKAEHVGTETCAACHEAQAKSFRNSPHAAYMVSAEGRPEGCESCHGPGSLHADSGGDKTKIVRNSAENCFACHLEKRAQFQLQFHHPVPEGRMNCSDCHNLHAPDARAVSPTALTRGDETCVRCHKELKGPFIFEHDAMREGCAACHEPHGAPFDKLLVASETSVCIRCHWELGVNDTGAQIGGISHAGYNIGRGEECIDHHRAPHGSNIWRTLNR